MIPETATPTPEPQRAAPRSPRRTEDWRRLLAVYAVTAMIESLGVAQVFAFLPLRLREVGLPDDQIPTFTGLFSSLIFVFGIVLVPFWGVLADTFSRRAVIVRSAVVETFVFIGVALAAAPWQVGASMLLVGLQLGNTGVMLAALRDVTPRDRVGTVSALYGAASPLGFAIGPVLGGVIIDGLGRPTTDVFVLAALASMSVVALLLFGSADVRPAVVPHGRVVDLAMRAVRGVLSDAAVRRIFLVFGVSMMANQMYRPFLPLLVERANGGAAGLASAIGLVAGTAALVGALISPAAGPLGDRFGFRRVLVVTLLAAGVSLLVMPFAPSVAVLAACAVVYAAMQAATQAMVFGLVAVEVAPERRSATLNLVLLPLYVAGIIGPTIGAAAAAIGGIPATYEMAGLVFVAGAALVAASIRPRRANASRQ